MEYRTLGRTDTHVSLICLGTMTYGEQNSEAEAFAQMDYALAEGVNFFDTAELYPIPPRAETYGRTEEIIGKWLHARKGRDKVVLSSKIAGPGEGWIDHIRGGKTRYTSAHIEDALNSSLQRLRTDYIDLYHLHWPERKTNFFGPLGYSPEADSFTAIDETLNVLADLVQAGKIRHIGLSNETPWGVMHFLMAADRLSLPRVVSVQNPYNLLNRSYEVGLAEISWREQCGLLAYSPLGFGVLTGKYLHGASPARARLTLYPGYTRYSNEQALRASELYVELARAHELNPGQMALAYVNHRRFLTSTIIGATSMEQLKTSIESVDVCLPDAVVQQIETIHTRYPNPSP